MALNALGGFRLGAVGRFGGSRFNVQRRGVGDLIVAQQVQAPTRRYVPRGPRFLGDTDLPARGHLPRFTPPARFAGGRFGGPRRGLRMRGLSGDETLATAFPDLEPVRPARIGGKRKGGKRCKPGRAVKCKMVAVPGRKAKRKMCWDKNGRLTRVPKRKK